MDHREPALQRSRPITFVISARNEERIIDRSVLLLHGHLAARMVPGSWRILVADNGSTDGTTTKVASLIQHFPDTIAAQSIPEAGRGNVFRAVALARPNDVLCFIDADLPLPLESIENFLLTLDDADIVVGRRREPTHRPLLRRVMSWCWGHLVRVLFDLPLHDPQCGILALTPAASHILTRHTTTRHWMANTEFLLAAHQRGLKIAESPIDWIDARYPERPSTVPVAQYVREAASFTMDALRRQNPYLLRDAAVVGTAALTVLALALYQYLTLTAPGFTVTHHLTERLPQLRAYILVSALSFGLLAVPLLGAFARLPWRLTRLIVVSVFLILATISIATHPTRSHDAYWNLGFGKLMVTQGANPYHTPLSSLGNDPWLDPVGAYQNMRLTHGPLWALTMFGVAAFTSSLGTALLIVKLLMLVLLFATGIALWRFSEGEGVPPATRIARVGTAAWSPLITQVALVDTHNDVLILAAIAVSLWMLSRSRYLGSALLLTAAGLVKYVTLPLLLVPLFALLASPGNISKKMRSAFLLVFLCGALIAVTYLPFGLPWQATEGLAQQLRVSSVWYSTVLSLPLTTLVGPLGAIVLATALGGLWLWQYTRKRRWAAAMGAPLISFLTLGTTWLQVWYLLWIAPLMITRAPAWLFAAFVSLPLLAPEVVTMYELSVFVILAAMGSVAVYILTKLSMAVKLRKYRLF